MASSELILSESDWKNLLLYKEYVKQLFQVDVQRKDEFGSHVGDHWSPTSALPTSPTQTTVPVHGNKNTLGNDLLPTNFPTSDIFRDDDFILRPPPVIVQIQTESSNSNLEKCRKFAVACSPSHPDFKSIIVKLDNHNSSEMVKACLPSIRQLTATLINYNPESMDITLQGHHLSVDLARQQIDMILQDVKPITSETQSSSQQNLNCNQSQSPGFNADTSSYVNHSSDLNFHPHNVHLSSAQTAKNVMSSPAKSDDSVFFSGEQIDQYEELFNFSGLSSLINQEEDCNENGATIKQTPFQSYNVTPCQKIEQSDSLSSSDLTDELDNILSDDRYCNRIDQAIKLGFSEEQVAKVLKKLGVNSSMEDMMRELVSEPQGLPADPEVLHSEELDSHEINLSSKEEESDDSEVFDVNDSSNLRHIIIDGSNVAMSHGQKVFSCLGIKIVVDWFKKRGHKNITVFVPQWRKEASRPDAPITNQEILTELEDEKIVVFTPSRRVGGTRIVCYDDRYVLQLAVEKDGIVVSNDVYRDLVRERDDFKEVVEKRLLMYSFVQDMFMPPEDPLGRQGPSLDNFLRIKPSEPKNKPQICPYGKKCTYGIKCRFYHPERRYSSNKMVAEKLKESAELKQKAGKAEKFGEGQAEQGKRQKQKLFRTVSLVPQNVMVGKTKSDVTSGDITKKPVLSHSKSLVYSNSYLHDLRLKMEEAESAEVLKRSAGMSSGHQESNQDPTHALVNIPKGGNSNEKQHSSSCNPSPRISPTPQTEVSKAKVKPVRSFPSSPIPNTSPSFTVNNVKSELNIPNAEPLDRYLSGHLLVVKKLSDEDNSNGKFFTQHTSRTTGTQQQVNDPSCFYGGMYSGNSNQSQESAVSQVPSLHQPEDKASQESNLWQASVIYGPPEIAKQGGFNETVRKTGSRTISPTTPFISREREQTQATTHSNINTNSEQFDSCPAALQTDGVYELPQWQKFKRSLSVNTSPHSVEHPKLQSNAHRKYSLNMTCSNSEEQSHAKMGPPSSIPMNQRVPLPPFSQYNTNAPTFHPQTPYRHRMSVDSGISSGGLSVDQSLNSSPFSPTENLISPFSYTPSLSSPGHVFSPLANIDNSTNHPSRVLMQPPENVYNPNPSNLSTSSAASMPFSPLPNRMQPFFQDRYTNMQHPAVSTTSNMPFQTQHPPMFRPPPPNSSIPTHYPMACPPPNQPQFKQQQPPTYSPQPMMTTGNPYYPVSSYSGAGESSPMPYSPSTPVSPFHPHQQPFIQQQSKVIDEEAAISVDDPRYSVYYNLSSVYGERAVRTFMNRNPDVRNFSELYSLIASYKQETGL